MYMRRDAKNTIVNSLKLLFRCPISWPTGKILSFLCGNMCKPLPIYPGIVGKYAQFELCN